MTSETNTAIRRHLLIGGTGRAGTSLLVRILEVCGLETVIGGSVDHSPFINAKANAGLESNMLLPPGSPYVVKSPTLHRVIAHLVTQPDIKIDGVILPVRGLAEAAASRIIVELGGLYGDDTSHTLDTIAPGETYGHPGGAAFSLEPLDQARHLAVGFHTLVETLLEHDIPICFLKFPRFTQDIDYLYRQLKPFLPLDLTAAEVRQRLEAVIAPDQIRVGKELTTMPRSTDAGASSRARVSIAERPDAFEMASLAQVENIALKRELLRVSTQSEVGKAHKRKLDAAEAEAAYYRLAFKDIESAYNDMVTALRNTQTAMQQTQTALQQTQVALEQTQAAYTAVTGQAQAAA